MNRKKRTKNVDNQEVNTSLSYDKIFEFKQVNSKIPKVLIERIRKEIDSERRFNKAPVSRFIVDILSSVFSYTSSEFVEDIIKKNKLYYEKSSQIGD